MSAGLVSTAFVSAGLVSTAFVSAGLVSTTFVSAGFTATAALPGFVAVPELEPEPALPFAGVSAGPAFIGHSSGVVLPAASFSSVSHFAPFGPTSLTLRWPAPTGISCLSLTVAIFLSSTNRSAEMPAGSASRIVAIDDGAPLLLPLDVVLEPESRIRNFTARKPPSTRPAIATPIATSRPIDDFFFASSDGCCSTAPAGCW